MKYLILLLLTSCMSTDDRVIACTLTCDDCKKVVHVCTADKEIKKIGVTELE